MFSWLLSHRFTSNCMNRTVTAMSVLELTSYFTLEQVFDDATEHGTEKLCFKLSPKKFGDTTFTFGRGNNCDFRFDSPDLPYLISRQHAQVILTGNDVFVMDLKSLNGTYVNDVMLRPNETKKVTNGDKITFGCLSLDDAVSPGKIVKQGNAPFNFVLKRVNPPKTLIDRPEKLRDLCDQDSGVSNCSPAPSTSSNCENLQEASTQEEETVPLTVKNLIAFSGCNFKNLQFSSDEKEKQDKGKSARSFPSTSKSKTPHKRRQTTRFSRKKRGKASEDSCAFYDCKVKESTSHDVISWVQCDNCNKWYHTDCIGCDYDAVKSAKRKFNCGLC